MFLHISSACPLGSQHANNQMLHRVIGNFCAYTADCRVVNLTSEARTLITSITTYYRKHYKVRTCWREGLHRKKRQKSMWDRRTEYCMIQNAKRNGYVEQPFILNRNDFMSFRRNGHFDPGYHSSTSSISNTLTNNLSTWVMWWNTIPSFGTRFHHLEHDSIVWNTIPWNTGSE